MSKGYDILSGRSVCAGIVFLGIAFFLGVDPLRRSVISGFPDFKAYSIEQPGAWSELQFGYDKQNRLQAAEVKFVNELAGPECLAFDLQGRGPYTGIGDGRIMRWNGPQVGWSEFAYTSPNRNFLQAVFSAESSGRVLKYNAKTKETQVLVEGLHFPNGLTLSKDRSFFIYASCAGRLRRYWVKGPKAGTTDSFAILPGYADNVRTNERGEFWVAMHFRRNALTHFLATHPRLRMMFLRLPVSAERQYMGLVGGTVHGIIAKYSADGELIDVLEDSQGKVVRAVSHVEEKDGTLWIGSVLMPYIATLNYNN